ncbi:hypothetical protein CHS0354_019339 [Potamilus streckersoni]|uniref:Disks large-associated protein 5 n=1 Tax=Potamilus streckersoni TaxID=2493646 RepID=A0AAE0VWS2_9BIVA|nr:hypothetical protein CHS0354_019339 [Potamilus streckersoni]
MEKRPICKSEFSSAYKMTTGIVDKKGMRLRRRSMEQKQMRRELTNKNRNIDNLSPLQEEDVSINKSYKEKTPIKRDKTGQDGQKIDNRKMQMLKWKEERMKAKKLEVAKKKPLFKISVSLEREDFTLFSKSKNIKNTSKPSEKTSVFMPAVAVQEKKKVNGIRTLEKSNVFMPVTTVQDKSRGNETKPLEKTKVLTPVTTIREKKKVVEYKDAVSKTTRNQGSGMMPPTNKAHSTRASTRSANKPIVTVTSSAARSKEKETYPSRITRQSTAKKVKENERPTPTQDAKKSTPEVCEDKVTTTRGGGEMSFAPEDFAFTAPSSITSYIFQPLSPASAAQFLYPTQDTSVSFYDSAPGRCSTPKSAGIDATKKILDKPVKDEREEDKKKSNGDGAVLEAGETLKVELNERKEVERQTKPQRSLRKSKAETHMQLEKMSSSGRVSRSMRYTSVEETANSDSDLCKQNHPNNELENQNIRVSFSSKKLGCIEAEENKKMDIMKECETVTDKTPGKKTSDSEEKMETETLNISHKKESVSETEERDCVATDMIDDLPSVSSLNSVEEGSQVTKQENKDTPLKTEIPQSQKRVTRRSVAVMEAEFACPSETSILRSAKKSSMKRRKTQLEKTSKSPEEWVELLRQSPMVEMTRRTPRRKSNADLNVTVPSLNFDDIDLDESLTITVEVPESNSDGTPVITTAQGLEPVECDDVPTLSMEPESTVTSTNVDTQNSQIGDSLGIPTGPSEVMVHDSSPNREEPACEQVQDPDVSSSSNTKPELADGEHNVKYFRSLLVHHTDRLTQLCDQWTEPINSTDGLAEDVKGQIRTVVGQAQLLMCQRFKQFAGLVDNCEFGLGEKETTCMDLQGFWDMIYFQVEDVDNKFEELSTLQKNNWVLKNDKPADKVPRKKPAQVCNPKPKTNVKSKFAAFRAQMKKQTQSDVLASPVATIPSNDTGMINVFDAGFFKVISPVRSPKPHCTAGTPISKSFEKDSFHSLSQGYITPALLRQTPLRKNYLPAVPSPLLQDTTPHRQSKRMSSIRKTTKQKNILACAEMQSELSNIDKENRSLTESNSVSDGVKCVSTISSEEAGTSHKESEMLKSTTPLAAFQTKSRRYSRKNNPVIFTEPVADKENSSTSISAIENSETKQSVSRSLRTRRSVSIMDDTSKQDQKNNPLACDLESGSDPFLKYLQPSKYLKPSNIVDTSLPFSSPEVEKSPIKRKISPSQEASPAKKSRLSSVHKSSLKATLSATKLRNRRSVRFSASADEDDKSSFKLPTTPYLTHRSGVSKDGDICNVIDEAAPRRSTRRSVSQQNQQLEDGLRGTTLIRKSARPSLLYDPEEMRASTKSFASGDLIVFTP